MRRHSARLLGPFSELFDWQAWLLPIGLALFLVFVSFHNYLLFHTAAEFFAIIIGVLLWVVAWHTYPFSQNSFLMYLGCGYFWIGVLDGVHTLVYKGMVIFPITVANPATQFWIATRYSEALLLLTAPLFLDRAVARDRTFWGFGGIAVVLYALVMTGNFPDAFIEGQGLTPFKVASEYVIVALLAAALVFLARRRALVEPRVFALLTVSIILTMMAELAFTFYVGVYGLSNVVGHIFKFFSFWLIFVAVIRQSLKEPYLDLERRVEEKTKDLQAEITERTQAEEALRESEERFRVLVENNPYGIQEIDTRGHITFTNPAHDKMFGYAQGEMLGKPVWEKVAPRTERDNLCRYLGELVREQPSPIPFFEQDRTKDGRLIDVFVHWAYKRDSEGRVIGFISTLSDVTEQKRAEKALRVSEKRLRAVIDHSPTAINLKDLEGRYLVVNKTYEEWHKTTQDEVVGRTAFELYPGNIAEAYVTSDRDVLETGAAYEHELEVQYPDGATRVTARIKFPILGDDGVPIGLGGIGFDITARKQMEKTLRESERRYRELFDNMGSCVAIYKAVEDGHDFIFVDFNRAGERTDEIERKDLVGRRVSEVFPGVVEFGLFAVFQRVWKTGVAEHFPVSHYQDGRVSGWRENFVYKLPTGELVAIYEDTTERRRAEEALWESNARSTRAHERLLDAIESISEGFALFDADERFVMCNSQYRRHLSDIEDLLVPGTPSEQIFRGYAERGFVFEAHGRIDEWVRERVEGIRRGGPPFEHYQKDGRWVSDHNFNTREGGSLVIRTDITERKRGEEVARRASEQLKALSHRLIRAQEDERRNISRLLHNDMTQNLGALMVGLQMDSNKKPLKLSDARKRMLESADHIKKLLQQTRDLSHSLRPPGLDELGLIAAIKGYLENNAKGGLVTFECAPETAERRFVAEVEVACFRVFQEALTNALRHSQAKQIAVSLASNEEALSLSVYDDGIGFELAGQEYSSEGVKGLGLIGMKEQASLAGGSVEIQSAPGQAVIVRACFPLDEVPGGHHTTGLRKSTDHG